MTRAQVLQRSLERCGAEYSPGEIEEACRRRRARRWFQGLGDRARLLLQLHYGDGLEPEEIAAVMDLPAGEIAEMLRLRLVGELREALQLESAGRRPR